MMYRRTSNGYLIGRTIRRQLIAALCIGACALSLSIGIVRAPSGTFLAYAVAVLSVIALALLAIATLRVAWGMLQAWWESLTRA